MFEKLKPTLRPVEEGDVPALYAVTSLPEFPRFMTWEAHTSMQQTRDVVRMMIKQRAEGTDFVDAMIVDGSVAGLIGLHDVTHQQRAWRMDRAELGYWVNPSYQGHGVATAAAREMIKFGFGKLKLHKITVGCIADNLPSKRIIEKIGFRFIGVQKDHCFRDGRWWDHLAYEMLAP